MPVHGLRGGDDTVLARRACGGAHRTAYGRGRIEEGTGQSVMRNMWGSELTATECTALIEIVEARVGIEPAYAELQSAT
jgi:hypothetical protein